MTEFKKDYSENSIVLPPTMAQYLQELYKNDIPSTQIKLNNSGNVQISIQELDEARTKLSNGKAMGIDDLRDTLLKDRKIWPNINQKIRNCFNEWLLGKTIPEYLNKAKIFALSKDSENP